MSRVLHGARVLPREALQELLVAWEARASDRLLERDRSMELSDSIGAEAAKLKAEADGQLELARALKWYIHALVARERSSLTPQPLLTRTLRMSFSAFVRRPCGPWQAS